MAKQLTFSYPDNLPDALQLTNEQFDKEALTAMVVKLFEMKKISSRTASSLLGIDRVTFIMLLRDWSVNYINYSGEELLSDLAS